LTSQSKLLRISLENDRCSLKCSDDGSVLILESPDKSFVTAIDVSLKDSNDKEISAVCLSMGCSFGPHRIRTDGLFSVIFDPDESIMLVSNSVFALLSAEFQDERRKFDMAVNIHLVDAIPDSFELRSSPVLIHTGSLKVADSPVPISKELMATTSLFFNSLFYGGFSEHQKGIFEIKEVDQDDFLWFINSIHRRNWMFTSVDRALTALTYADRFEMLYLHKNILPYLKNNSLPAEEIKDTLLLCERFEDNEELIAWVLSQCKNVQAAIELVSECAPFIQMSSVHSALKAVKESVDCTITDTRRTVVKDCLENQELPVLFRFKDTQTSAVKSYDLFTISCNGSANRTVDWATEIWPKIPEAHDTAVCEGRTFTRGGSDSVRYVSNKALLIDAFHS
ncbi:hypothetical protein PENTCL1PPCAC_12834, partial [Pristionchus entomophagus]